MASQMRVASSRDALHGSRRRRVEQFHAQAAGEIGDLGCVALARACGRDRDGGSETSGLAGDRNHLVGEEDRLVDGMGDEQDGLAGRGVDARQLALQRFARDGVSAANGSSISRMSGSTASARASATRWR